MVEAGTPRTKREGDAGEEGEEQGCGAGWKAQA